jgi:hypothetical protein
MSFTPTNNGGGGSMPDINVRMVPVGQPNNYESQGMERAISIGQDGRPIGKVEYVPPFDLLTEENRQIIEQRKRQNEAKKRKENEAKRLAENPIEKMSSDEILRRAEKNLIGKSYKYITSDNFGKIVSIVSCQLKENEEIQITMDDGFTIAFDDLESQFIPDNSLAFEETEEIIIQEPQKVSTPKVVKEQSTQKFQSSLPNSPLKELLSARKKNMNPISLNLTIDLVKRDFYKILDESYENTIDYVVEHAMSNITMEDVKKAIKKELESYYNIEGSTLTDNELEKKTIYTEPDMIILEKSE